MAKFQRTSEHAQSAIIQRNTWKHLEFVKELVVKSPNILFTFADVPRYRVATVLPGFCRIVQFNHYEKATKFE